jgi:hypothetical protein
MLINPNSGHLPTFPETRMLQEAFGLAGWQFTDLRDPQRIWTLQYFLSPIPGRALGGIRARFLDNKNFVSYCNQRDLEVLLGIGTPGRKCLWGGGLYPEVGDSDWYGLCVDGEDLTDDLQDRELRLRQSAPGILPTNMEMQRTVHDAGSDTSELLYLIGDMDFVSGYGPDMRIETIEQRWVRIERHRVEWTYV